MPSSLRNIGVVAMATVVSRVLGLVREIVLAAVFGTSALNSAFVTAFTLPNLFRRLLGEGALTAAFVPTLTAELEARQRAAAFALLSKVTTRLAAVTVALVGAGVLVFANADRLTGLAARFGMDQGAWQRLLTAADLAVLLFPYLVFVCLAAAFSAACQVLGRFTEPALSPIWLNLAIIGALCAGSWSGVLPQEHMRFVCLGVLAGGFVQMAVPAAVLIREGWRPRFDLRSDERVREIARLMLPMLLGSSVYLINMAMTRVIGLSLNDQATTLLNLATRVMELPIGVFTAAIATVVFPQISRHAARGDWAALGDDYHRGMRLALVINIPAAIGLAVLSEPVVRLLFQRGAFRAEDSALMAPILAIFAAGLPLLCFTTIALRGYYALKDTATPVRAAIWSFLVNIGLSLLLMHWWSTIGLAVASNAAMLVQAVYLQVKLEQRQPALTFAGQWSGVLKIAAASALMGALVFGGAALLESAGPAGRAGDLLTVGALIPAGCALYGVLLWAFRIEGRHEALALLKRSS